MKPVTRQIIFEQAARKLRQEFEELSNTLPHAGVKGTEDERILRAFLNAHLPKRFAAGSGFIIDREDNVSKQTDVIVYDALNCPVYRASDEAAIVPNDNVAAVIEVKARLDKQRLLEAVDNIAAAKRLKKSSDPQEPVLVEIGNPSISTPNAEASAQRARFSLKGTYGCVFAFESALTLKTVTEHLTDATKRLGDHVDLIVVLNRGLISLMSKVRGSPEWGRTFFDGIGGSNMEGAHIGYGVYEIGNNALDAFIRMLLSRLAFFRAMIGHPGIDWGGGVAPEVQIYPLTTITFERDPQLRQQKIDQYVNELKQELKSGKK